MTWAHLLVKYGLVSLPDSDWPWLREMRLSKMKVPRRDQLHCLAHMMTEAWLEKAYQAKQPSKVN